MTDGPGTGAERETVPQRAAGLSLAIRGVSMAYGDGRVVVKDINLEVQQGQFVSLIGASGCGKTTLLNLVAGFLHPSSGRVELDSFPVQRPGPDRSMVFQDDAVFPWYTVQQNVEYALRFRGIKRADRARRVAELISLVGLAGRERAYPRELSGGMRKRVDVARALAPQPRVLLMDEPFAALDAITKMRLQSEFLRLWDQSGMTVLFVTHDIEEALFLSDRVVLMASNPGRVLRDVAIAFSRPRSDDLRTASEFQQLRHELTAALHLSDQESDPTSDLGSVRD
jgi:NitT/TauT family transport system ATP-binding protein